MVQFEKEYLIQYQYINFPIRNHAPKHILQIILDGLVVREFTVELAVEGARQWWAHYDVNEFRGKKIIIRSREADLVESQAELLSQLVTQSDSMLVYQDLYRERLRPQLHFTPRRGWNNDPNGLVYHERLWHLFYQHNPFGIEWGNMHWGHAISQDLVHWVEQPIALFPKSLDDMVFSGGGIIDTYNTSGFGIAAEEPMVLSFTSTGRGECLAFSLDSGRSFQEYRGNPVLVHQGRDPKIIWHSSSKRWVMIVYDESDGKRSYCLYGSDNLKNWHFLQNIPDWYECPELFDLPIEETEPVEYKWIIYGSILNEKRSAFQVGNFDGKRFVPESDVQFGHTGPHFYAAQIFSHAPENRCIMLGWLAGAEYPEMPFGNGLSLPLELSLRKCEEILRLCFYPVKEIESLRIDELSRQDISVNQANELLKSFNHELLDLEIEMDALSQEPFEIHIGNQFIAYDPMKREVEFAGQAVPCQPTTRRFQLRIVIDRSVTEVFVDRGWGAFAAMTLFAESEPRITFNGKAIVETFKIFALRSIWDQHQSA